MKTKLFLLILILLVAFSCRSKKEAVKMDVQSNEVVGVDTKAAETTKQLTAIDTQVSDKSTISEATDELTTVVLFYAPDSLGRQYPISISQTVKSGKKEIANNKWVEAKETVNIKRELTSEEKINAIMGVKQKINEKTTETKAPVWASWGIIALFVGLFFLVYLVLKRYKVL